MGMGIRGGVARQLQSLLDAGAIGSMNDGELLGRFLRRDSSAEPAFAALVDRHGRRVLRVCLDILGDSHEAQDAAQATFFILARKAAAIREPEALPCWLHGTARRVASRALRDSIRRRRHERRSAEIAARNPASDDSRQGWPELHEELSRLPDRYREPIILCDLFELTHEQAARKLGCPTRTLETRLYRGRERLKDRLVRRGVAPSVALVGVAWTSESQAAISPTWVAESAAAAVRLSGKAGWSAAGEVSSNAVRWARNHIKELAMFKLKLVLACGLLLGMAWRQVKPDAPPPNEPVKTNGAAKAQQTTPEAVPDPAKPKIDTCPLTVSGRAFDPDGKPFPGARVYIASRWADYKRVAETTTDAEGRYKFVDVPLPIARADVAAEQDHGTFQVFGEAKGFGFAWRLEKQYYPNPVPPTFDVSNLYQAGDKIELDLRFSRSARLFGTVIDDRGKPIPDVRLEIRDCESGVLLDNSAPQPFNTLNERDSAPASMKLRTTDPQGRFEFVDMPADCRFRLSVNAKGFPRQWIFAATANESPRLLLGQPVQTGELKVTMAIPLDVPIKMIFADTGKPAAKVAVQAGGLNISAFESSDDQGRANLRLPPGKYRMSNWPARGTPYLVTEGELEVGPKPPEELLFYTLRPAAILDVTVVDQVTGKGLAGVDLWQGDPTDGHRKKFLMPSWEEATRIAWQDSPRTDEHGKLRAFVEPGLKRFGVGFEASPRWYVPGEQDGRDVDCRAGVTTPVEFTMLKVKP
jgi:RNA polymerase sigma factor (sigma-70 family)